jgi:hypothetical protein
MNQPNTYSINHNYNPKKAKGELSILYYKVKIKLFSYEFGRLDHGNKYNITTTDTIDYIQKFEVPVRRDIMYNPFVCNYCPLQRQPCQCRIVVSGDKFSYDNDTISPTASLLETKLILNSTNSKMLKVLRRTVSLATR